MHIPSEIQSAHLSYETNYTLVLDLSAGLSPSVVSVESSLWLLHVHSALFEAEDVTHVDEEEAVPKQVHLPEGPLIHHPGCQPEQNKHNSFSRVHFRNLQENKHINNFL